MELGLIKLVEYLKLNIESLEQDMQNFEPVDSYNYSQTQSTISAYNHILSVSNDILKASDKYAYTEDYYAAGHSQTISTDRK